MLGVGDVMLSGKKALVTGGGGGIGRAIALTLANFGADVAVVDLKRDGAQETATQVRKLGCRAAGLHGDVGDRKALEAAFAVTLSDLGGLDIVVNNAGTWNPKPALWTSEEEWDRQVDVNLKAVFLLSKMAAERWVRERLPGVIVNVATTEGIRGCPNYAAYSAAKAGVINFTKTLSSELGPYGIRVNAVAPDYTPTPGTTPGGYKPGQWDRLAGFIPLRRIGTEDDTAGAVLFLASNLASWITGQTITVDGGALACARVEGPMPVANLRHEGVKR